MTTTSSSLEYKIEVQFAEARVTPPPDSRLMSELEYSTREFSIDNKQGHCREGINTFCLWRLDQLEESSPAADALIFPTGLVWRVKNWLQAGGATVNVKDHRKFGAKLARCNQVFNNAEGEEREIVEAVAKHRMGCLQVTSWHETLATADLLMQLYPGARSLIAVPTRDGAKHVRRELVQAHDRWVGLTKARQPVPGHQWVVACYTDLNAVATENWQLVLFLDQSSVLNERAKRLLGKLADTPHKRYLIGRQPFGDRDQVTQCEAMFGPWIHRQPDHRLRI